MARPRQSRRGRLHLGLTNFANNPIEPTLGDGYGNTGGDGSCGRDGFTGPEFRLHLRGISEILNVESPNPVSISGPFDSAGVS